MVRTVPCYRDVWVPALAVLVPAASQDRAGLEHLLDPVLLAHSLPGGLRQEISAELAQHVLLGSNVNAAVTAVKL